MKVSIATNSKLDLLSFLGTAALKNVYSLTEGSTLTELDWNCGQGDCHPSSGSCLLFYIFWIWLVFSSLLSMFTDRLSQVYPWK